LIKGLGLGVGALENDPRDFAEMGEHISATERQAAAAERDAVDRFTAAFLADRIGAQFLARIGGVTRFGLFVTLAETNADALVPIASLPDDYYVHDEDHHLLRGRHSGRMYKLGDSIDVTLIEADPLTGSLLCHVMDSGKAPKERRKSKKKRAAHRKGRKKNKTKRQP